MRRAALALACAACVAAPAHAVAPSSSDSSSSSAAASLLPALPPGTGHFELAPAVGLAEAGPCSYTWQPPGEAEALRWELNRGAGPHSRGLVAPRGAHRVSLGEGEHATTLYFQARPARERCAAPPPGGGR